MELQLHESKKKVSLADEVFGRPYSEPLVHQVLVALMAGARAGTKATKNRAAVRGGGRKPWRQKGTGRARAGTIRSPIWRGGGHGIALGPRDHSQKINKKMYRGAVRSILSELLRQERFEVREDLSLDAPKTARLAALIAPEKGQRLLLLVGEQNSNLALAARNLSWVELMTVAELDPITLVQADRVIATVAAVNALEERLK